jgi:pimeloyl-ACP methyl ester carboxylesterase
LSAALRHGAAWAALVAAVGCSPAFQTQPLPASKADRKFVEVGGFRLHFDVVGEGAPVLFLHGFSSFLPVWDDTARALAAGRKSILVDLPGHGRSDRRNDDYTPRGVAATMLGFLDAVGEQRVSVVAHSWGASVALAMALAAPERIDRIVIVDGWMFAAQANTFMSWSQREGVGEFLWAWFYDQHVEQRYAAAFLDPEAHLDDRVVDALRGVLERPGSRAAGLAAIRGLKALPEQETRYGEIASPALLIWCREDRVSPPHFGEVLSNTLPDATLKVIPLCNHMPMVEQPAAFTGLLKGFLPGGVKAVGR